jgi:hypothetical protein
VANFEVWWMLAGVKGFVFFAGNNWCGHTMGSHVLLQHTNVRSDFGLSHIRMCISTFNCSPVDDFPSSINFYLHSFYEVL